MQAAINYCVDTKRVHTHRVKLWRPKKPDPKDRWLTKGEAVRLIGAAMADAKTRRYLVPFILISLRTGARRDKVLALRWQPNAEGGYVDLEHDTIYFQPVGKAQTNKRGATMPIPASLKPLLTILRRRNKTYVMEDEAGGRVIRPKRSWETAVKRAELSGVTPHTLKHTAVTWMLRNGVDLWDVSRLVGTSVTILEKVYGHHCRDRLRAVAAEL